MSSIDIDSAIAAHRAWSSRLSFYLDGISEDVVTVERVGDFTACVLGRWLYGSGEDYKSFVQYHELLEVHKQFHLVAAEVVRLHHLGDDETANQLLAGEFEDLSHRVVEYLKQLKIDGY